MGPEYAGPLPEGYIHTYNIARHHDHSHQLHILICFHSLPHVLKYDSCLPGSQHTLHAASGRTCLWLTSSLEATNLLTALSRRYSIVIDVKCNITINILSKNTATA